MYSINCCECTSFRPLKLIIIFLSEAGILGTGTASEKPNLQSVPVAKEKPEAKVLPTGDTDKSHLVPTTYGQVPGDGLPQLPIMQIPPNPQMPLPPFPQQHTLPGAMAPQGYHEQYAHLQPGLYPPQFIHNVPTVDPSYHYYNPTLVPPPQVLTQQIPSPYAGKISTDFKVFWGGAKLGYMSPPPGLFYWEV